VNRVPGGVAAFASNGSLEGVLQDVVRLRDEAYAAGASGNVATEDVVYLLEGLGIETGIDLDKVVDTGIWISSMLKRDPGSKAGRAIAAKKAKTA